ncbi:MAG: prephenate dehydrogenase [Bacteroidetes bacterium ADurb.Bin408]|nr:MAG: prephenate dehydrogenase [Bacteroidetes bacterium ADurb.Bin408]
MTGTEKAGYEAGFAHLFENAYYILTPCKSTTDYALDRMFGIINAIGGIPCVLGAEEHDRITGTISHVPHIIASALVNLVRESDTHDGKMQMLAAGGFKDITRIASSSPEMWESIILSNKPHVDAILNEYVKIIERFRNSVTCDDSREIYNFFESAGKFRNSIPSNRKGLLCPVYEIVVDVVDKPGIIAKIATIIGDNNINIKNINVSNSREFEQGCLRITLPDVESMNLAYDLLHRHEYKVYKIS